MSDLVADHRQGLKVHLRELHTPSGALLRVVTLRHATRARFSTNFFHSTWHLLSDGAGAALLARLLWGLAFQRRPGTVVLLHGEHLVPTPFEADPPDPILLAQSGTRLEADALRCLRKTFVRRAPVGKTIRWHTFGFPLALEAGRRGEGLHWRDVGRLRQQERMGRVGGVLCYSAPPEMLKEQALRIHALQRCGGMGYHFLAEHRERGCHADGEVQIFRTFQDMVSAARVARREVLGSKVLGRERRLESEAERQDIYSRAEGVAERLHTARRGRDAARGR